MIVRRGDIFFADLSPVVGSEQGGIRPVLIVQNDIGNKYSDSNLRRHHLSDEQGEAADAHRAFLRGICTAEGFRCAAGADSHD